MVSMTPSSISSNDKSRPVQLLILQARNQPASQSTALSFLGQPQPEMEQKSRSIFATLTSAVSERCINKPRGHHSQRPRNTNNVHILRTFTTATTKTKCSPGPTSPILRGHTPSTRSRRHTAAKSPRQKHQRGMPPPQ